MLIHAYLDVQTSHQSLPDLKAAFETFARRKGHGIRAFYNDQAPPQERSSLFRLLRDKGVAIGSQPIPEPAPLHDANKELFRLLTQARPNDVLLIESARVLARLSGDDWQLFRKNIRQRKIRVVSLDVEASWLMVTSESGMATIAEQLTATILDMLEVTPLRGQKESRSRHLEGIAKAKARGKYKGRPVDRRKHDRILALLKEGYSWSEVCVETGASRSTVARVVKSE